jgi:hypothetical protein
MFLSPFLPQLKTDWGFLTVQILENTHSEASVIGSVSLPCCCRELQSRAPGSHGFEPLEASAVMLCLICVMAQLRERNPETMYESGFP